jgi:hypothetical protein
VHQKVWGNHAATLISSGSFIDFIILNVGYFFLNSPSQSLFNTLVWLSFLKEFYFFKLVEKSLAPHFLMHSTYVARHSFAIILLQSEAPIAFISKALGHSNVAETYLGFFEDDKDRGYMAALR